MHLDFIKSKFTDFSHFQKSQKVSWEIVTVSQQKFATVHQTRKFERVKISFNYQVKAPECLRKIQVESLINENSKIPSCNINETQQSNQKATSIFLPRNKTTLSIVH